MTDRRRAILETIIDDDTATPETRMRAFEQLQKLGIGSEDDDPMTSLRVRMARLSEEELVEVLELFGNDLPQQEDAITILRLCLGDDPGEDTSDYWTLAKLTKDYPQLLALVATMVEDRARQLADRDAIEAEIERRVLAGVRELADPDRRAEEITATARQLADQWMRETLTLNAKSGHGPRRASEPMRGLPAAPEDVLALPAPRGPLRRGLRAFTNQQ